MVSAHLLVADVTPAAMTAAAPLAPPLRLLLAAEGEPMRALPTGAPLALRLLLAAGGHMPPDALALLQRGHFTSRAVRAATAEIARTVPLGVTLTRSEADRAASWVFHNADALRREWAA